jgi:hypothetical protein
MRLHRGGPIATDPRHARDSVDNPYQAIQGEIGDLIDLVVQIEPRPKAGEC